MTLFSKSKSDFDCTPVVSDIIDLSEFLKNCEKIKNELKKIIQDEDASSAVSSFEDIEGTTTTMSLNLALLSKWNAIYKEHSNDSIEDINAILEEEKSALSTIDAQKESEIVRRILNSELSTAEVLKNQCEILNTSKTSSSLKPCCGSTNHSTVSWTENDIKVEGSETLVRPDEIILSISIFPGGKASLLHPIHKQEIEIKGSDPLNSLRDSIYCLSAKVVEDTVTDQSQKDILKSSAFFYIENTFYDDALDAQSSSRPSDMYFEALKSVGNSSMAAQALSPNPDDVQRSSLSSTKWLDLKIRLNKPYIFAHLGCCEHLFMITNIRAVRSSEEKTLSIPRILQSLRVRRRKCRVCEVYAGSKMLIDDKLMPENPCVICDKCFEGFHGNENLWYNDFEIDSYYHEV